MFMKIVFNVNSSRNLSCYLNRQVNILLSPKTKQTLHSIIKRGIFSLISYNHNNRIFCYNYNIRRNYYKYKYSPEVEAAVNQQIQAEQQAAQNYINMAVTFLHPCQSRFGAGGFFMRMYEEEIGHMQDFIHYQLLRGGAPVINGLTAPNRNMSLTLLDAFKQALEMEKSVTELLENVVRVAEAIKDYQCADYVTSVFLAEQMRSVNEMSHHITKLSRLSDDELAIYHYDLELAKSYPYSYKTKSHVG